MATHLPWHANRLLQFPNDPLLHLCLRNAFVQQLVLVETQLIEEKEGRLLAGLRLTLFEQLER